MRRSSRTKWRPCLETLEARRLLSTVWADFNNDGFDDLAIGVPGEDVGSAVDAGSVNVIYGSAAGLTNTGNEFLTQDTPGISDTAEATDNFGAALAAGDFNGDGRTDLAIGAPGEDLLSNPLDVGQIHIVYGKSEGLVFDVSGTAGGDTYSQDTNRVRDVSEAGDFFGKSLATGDFNNDGFCDLAIGVPGQDVGTRVDGGAIHVFYGTALGLKPPANQTFNGGMMTGSNDPGDAFGSALAAGDYNGDGRADLAIGIPLADDVIAVDYGRVVIMYSGSIGLTPAGNQPIPHGSGSGARFGSALVSGDFNNDNIDDLAVGAPFATVSSVPEAGSINTYNGSGLGMLIHLSIVQINLVSGNVGELGDRFGAALTSGDFNNDGFDDLAVAAPGESVGSTLGAGQVNVLFGTSGGIKPSDDIQLNESNMLFGSIETDDHFGETLAAGNFDGFPGTELVIGTPDEDVGPLTDAGTVYALYGPTFSGRQQINQDTPGILDSAEAGDGFGGGLSSGDTKSAPGGGSGRKDLAHFITADLELDFLPNANKRRLLSGRR